MEIYIIVKVLEQQLGKLYLPLATTLPTQLPKLVAELLEPGVLILQDLPVLVLVTQLLHPMHLKLMVIL